MEIYNKVLNDYNLKIGDKIKSNVGGYVDDLKIVKAIKLKDGSIKLVIKPEIPYPNHPKPFNVDIDEAIKFHNRIAESASIQIYNRVKKIIKVK